MNAGRDYIVEYKVGQFQHGSLVLRFADEPSASQLRGALVDHGLSAGDLQEVHARPLGAPRPAAPVGSEAADPPQVLEGRSRSGKWIVLPLLIGLFGLGMMTSQPATDMGQLAGTHAPGEGAVDHCARQLDSARAGESAGVIGALFSDRPTAFPLSPANAAFMVACLGESAG